MQNASARARPDLKVVQPGSSPAGDPQERSALVQNVTREMAWLWMATTVNDPQQQRDCLQRVLALNPQNTVAQQALAALSSGQGTGGVASKGAASALETLHLPPGQINVPGILRVLRNNITVDQLMSQPRTTTSHAATVSMDQFANIMQEPRDPDYVPSSNVAAHAVSPFQASSGNPYTWGQATGDATAAWSTTATASATPTSSTSRQWLKWKWQPALHQRAVLFAALAMVVVLLLVLVLERIYLTGDVAAGAPNETSTQAKSAAPTPWPVNAAATAITTARGIMMVPGTAFTDGRLGVDPPSTLSVVWLWEEPTDQGSRVCSLPHGTSVLVQEAKLAPDGQRSFRIQNRECSGWVSAELISPTAQQSQGRIINNENWAPSK